MGADRTLGIADRDRDLQDRLKGLADRELLGLAADEDSQRRCQPGDVLGRLERR